NLQGPSSWILILILIPPPPLPPLQRPHSQMFGNETPVRRLPHSESAQELTVLFFVLGIIELSNQVAFAGSPSYSKFLLPVLQNRSEPAEYPPLLLSPPSCFMCPGICILPPDGGLCYNLQERWYFDYEKKTCLPFSWSGCGGNENNFKSRPECQKACSRYG
uniref:BPTI/Kunitz inhibitor domain-containing protein n=1 Tax=Laticauda laticaudata TaxID=8630 RepID=A0A8C5WUQ5_LATLA